MKKISFPFLLILIVTNSFAQKTFDFTKTCQFAYYKMMSLHFEEGDSLLTVEMKQHPDNLMPYFIANYKDFFICAINEDPADEKNLYPHKAQRLTVLATGPEDSPYYLYTQALVNMEWGFVHIKAEQYTTGFFEIKKAYSELNENQKKFPAFVANKIYLGFIHGAIGTVPDNYKWAVTILGFSGTVNQGMGEIQEALDYSAQHPFIFEDETHYVCSFLKMALLNDLQGAYTMTQESDFPYASGNPLSTFVRGYMATKINSNDEAIKIFASRNFHNGSFQFYYLDYLLGTCKLRRLDDDANVPLEKFVANFHGRNYLKDAYQKIAWYYLLKGDRTKYDYWIAFCKTKGADFADSDQEALKEAESGTPPNIILLKTRLLQDGGYYDKAIAQLAGKSSKDFSTARDQIEFTYRAGRIYHEWGKVDEAIPYYYATIKNGETYPFYFAARSALELGGIFEQRGEIDKAKYYYQKCLSMKNTEYKTSLDQKAKAGLNRLQ